MLTDNKVYLLMEEDWEDRWPVGIFISRELAEQYMEKFKTESKFGYNLFEIDITKTLPEKELNIPSD